MPLSITPTVDPDSGAVEFVAGDDVTLEWTIADYDGDIASGDAGVLRMIERRDYESLGDSAVAELEKAFTASLDDTDLKLTVELTSAETTALSSWPPQLNPSHKVQLVVTTSAGKKRTSVLVDALVKRRIEPAT